MVSNHLSKNMGQIGHLPQNRDEPYDKYLVETNHLDFINLDFFCKSLNTPWSTISRHLLHRGVDGVPILPVFNLNVTSKNPLFMPPWNPVIASWHGFFSAKKARDWLVGITFSWLSFLPSVFFWPARPSQERKQTKWELCGLLIYIYIY